MKRLFILVFIGFGILVACSNQEDTKQKILDVAKDFKMAVYTVDYESIPEQLHEKVTNLRERAQPFLTEEELESQIKNRRLGLPTDEADKCEADIEVKDMEFEFMDLPDNSETNKNLSYTMTIQFVQDKDVIEEYTFDGRMRVEKRDDGWKIDWDEDKMYAEIMK